MQELSLGINALSGEVPKELGKLTNLLSLRFSSNNFSGSLPSELGNLTKLEQLMPAFDINGTADFVPTVSNKPPTSSKKSKTGLIIGIVVSVGVISFLSILALCWFIHQKRRSHRNEDAELLGIDARPYTFSYAELKAATGDFNPANKLGQGGFGPVFKGTLNDGRVIAGKQLSVASHQGKSQFVAEIVTISAVQHMNLVKLYGCCIEGDKRLLVYEYLENKSLDQALFGKTSLCLNWPIRFDICLGVAREKADVYGFGIVALEIVSGRPNSDSSLEEEKIYLLEWAWHLHKGHQEVELVDEDLPEFNEEEVKRVIGVALLCTQTSPQLCPSMSLAVKMLIGDIEVSPVISQPGYMTEWKLDEATGFITTDTPASKDKYSNYSSSTNTSMVTDPDLAPINATGCNAPRRPLAQYLGLIH
ncbi:hypothetical protein Vadar_023582 [Vaccinium darrowii]|uniref:Uncharacterized protein n=1 Tax=Vaccinium darrowii TaxID=229202 RepID=A0ACB7YQA7_9ERIC|nr:hypothetical protein Vadar_023582 [Vaccinium darrowii]